MDSGSTYIGQTSRKLSINTKDIRGSEGLHIKMAQVTKKMDRFSALAAHSLYENNAIKFQQASIMKQEFIIRWILTKSTYILNSGITINRIEGITVYPIWSNLLERKKQFYVQFAAFVVVYVTSRSNSVIFLDCRL